MEINKTYTMYHIRCYGPHNHSNVVSLDDKLIYQRAKELFKANPNRSIYILKVEEKLLKFYESK